MLFALTSFVYFRRETFYVSDKKPATDSNDNVKPTNAAVAVPQTPDSQSPLLDYRFSVGQLPSWAKRQVFSLFTFYFNSVYTYCYVYIHTYVSL